MEEKVLSVELFEKSPLYLAYRLVEEGKIDPWDVDLEKLINEYLETIRRIELTDLRVPAKVVAFATFLIKKQLEILFPKPPRPKVRRKLTLKEIEEEFASVGEEVLETVKRKVSRRTSKRKKERTQPKETPKPPLFKAKLEEALEYLLSLLERLEEEKRLAFSRFATKNDYVAKLWALLNLTSEGKLEMEQTEPFGEIYFWKVSLK